MYEKFAAFDQHGYMSEEISDSLRRELIYYRKLMGNIMNNLSIRFFADDTERRSNSLETYPRTMSRKIQQTAPRYSSFQRISSHCYCCNTEWLNVRGHYVLRYAFNSQTSGVFANVLQERDMISTCNYSVINTCIRSSMGTIVDDF